MSNEFDDDFFDSFDEEESDEEREVLEELGKKYFLIAINNANNFINLSRNESINFHERSLSGFDEKELENLFDKFVENGVIAIFMQYNLMVDFTENKKVNRMFEFVPMKGKDKIGILVPKEVVINEGKPDRKDIVGSDKDMSNFNDMMEKFNSGTINFDDFLNSI